MQSYKNGKWAKEILALRQADGLWGNFHALSHPTGKGYTTEQAIRRLCYLGYTAEDECIGTVLRRMEQCVKGERAIDNYAEKTHDWARVVENAFASGQYRREDDSAAFTQWRGRAPKSGFEMGFGMFYHAALLAGVLPPDLEVLFLDYYLTKPDGMYYIYDKPLNQPPAVFASRASSCYLAAIEVLHRYGCAKEKLRFVRDWLYAHQDKNGQWHFGAQAKDGATDRNGLIQRKNHRRFGGFLLFYRHSASGC